MSDRAALVRTLKSFHVKNLITDVLNTIKSGKEATVFRCKAHPSTGKEFFAAKVYRSLQHRSFRNDSVYQQGRLVWSGGNSRALKRKSKWGRSIQLGNWIATEFETLSMLYRAGVDVPQPFARSGNAILMEYIGDEQASAAMLNSISLHQDSEPQALFDQLIPILLFHCA